MKSESRRFKKVLLLVMVCGGMWGMIDPESADSALSGSDRGTDTSSDVDGEFRGDDFQGGGLESRESEVWECAAPSGASSVRHSAGEKSAQEAHGASGTPPCAPQPVRRWGRKSAVTAEERAFREESSRKEREREEQERQKRKAREAHDGWERAQRKSRATIEVLDSCTRNKYNMLMYHS